MTPSREGKEDDFVCPHCGADVPAGAVFCRECGASDESGWVEGGCGPDDEYADNEDFDYEEFLAREFPSHLSPLSRLRLKPVLLGVVVAILCVALVLLATLNGATR